MNIKADRIDGNGQMDTRIVNCMKALGFTRHRETTGKRRRGYMRKVAGTAVQASVTASGAAMAVEDGNDLPF